MGFHKLNFDEASRGNPGLASIGVVLRNYKGDFQPIFSQSIGEATNNETKFTALEKGLWILIHLGTGAIVVEGDSLLEINATRKM